MRIRNRRGLTLIEVLLSLAIIVIVMGLFVGILATSAKIQLRQSALSEVSNQANFAMQTIQRLIRESSASYVNCSQTEMTKDDDFDETDCSGTPGETMIGKPQRFLRLRMPEDARDPTMIWAEYDASALRGVVKIREGNNSSRELFTTDKVSCIYDDSIANHCLTFKKYTNYPGRDHIEINLALTAVQGGVPNPGIARQLITSVSRASAATFDSGVFPGGTNYDLGDATTPWDKLYVKEIRGKTGEPGFKQPDNYDGILRGALMVGAAEKSCSTICNSHGLVCYAGYNINVNGTLSLSGTPPSPTQSCAPTTLTAGFCFCTD